MASRSKYDYTEDFAESGNYNVAKLYAGMMIGQHMADLDEYRKICMFGTMELMDGMMLNDETKTRAKLDALYRYIETSILIIDNTFFAIRDKKKDLPEMENLREQLTQTKSLLPLIKKEKKTEGVNGKTTQVVLIQDSFDSILNIVNMIVRNLKVLLNKSDLIFNTVEMEDWEVLKKEEMEKMINQG